MPDDDTPDDRDQLRRHAAELARRLATHAHGLATLAAESARLHAMAAHLEHQLDAPDTQETEDTP